MRYVTLMFSLVLAGGCELGGVGADAGTDELQATDDAGSEAEGPNLEPDAGPPPAPKQRWATVKLEAVLMNVVDPNGAPWDGPGAPEDVEQDLASALELVDAFASFQGALDALERLGGAFEYPEIYGIAQLEVPSAGVDETIALSRDGRDSLYCQFYGPPKFVDVPLERDALITLRLHDEDAFVDDYAGVASFDLKDIAVAQLAHETYPVKLADEGTGSILFVQIAVLPSDGSTRTSPDSDAGAPSSSGF